MKFFFFKDNFSHFLVFDSIRKNELNEEKLFLVNIKNGTFLEIKL